MGFLQCTPVLYRYSGREKAGKVVGKRQDFFFSFAAKNLVSSEVAVLGFLGILSFHGPSQGEASSGKVREVQLRPMVCLTAF